MRTSPIGKVKLFSSVLPKKFGYHFLHFLTMSRPHFVCLAWVSQCEGQVDEMRGSGDADLWNSFAVNSARRLGGCLPNWQPLKPAMQLEWLCVHDPYICFHPWPMATIYLVPMCFRVVSSKL